MLITVLVLVIVIVIGKRLSKGWDNKKDYDYEHRFAEHEHDLVGRSLAPDSYLLTTIGEKAYTHF